MNHGLEAAYRCRRALISILLIATASSSAFAILQPGELRTSGRLWMEPSVFEGARPDHGSPVAPAESGAAAIREFLNTRSFCLEVGRRSGLTAYLVRDHNQSSLGSTLLPKSRSKLDGAAIDDAVFELIRKKVVVTPVGADVVELTMTFKDPPIAAAALGAVVEQFIVERLELQRAQAARELQLYRGEEERISLAVGPADAAVAEYMGLHPPLQRGVGAPPDATLLSLQSAAKNTRERFERAVVAADAAGLRLAQLDGPKGGGVDILDAPQLAAHPDGADRLASALSGGVAVGVFLSILAIYVLAAMDRARRGNQGIRADAIFLGAVPFLSPHPSRYRTLLWWTQVPASRVGAN